MPCLGDQAKMNGFPSTSSPGRQSIRSVRCSCVTQVVSHLHDAWYRLQRGSGSVAEQDLHEFELIRRRWFRACGGRTRLSRFRLLLRPEHGSKRHGYRAQNTCFGPEVPHPHDYCAAETDRTITTLKT